VPKRDLIIIASVFLLTCALYFLFALLVTEPGFPLDDAWIHQVFARNLITGHGFAFHPDHPISAVTAPLWTLLLAPFWLIMGPIASAILLGVFLEFLAIIAIYKLTELLTGNNRLAFLTGLLSALSWVLVWGALSGMEIGLYSALSLWGLYFYFKAEEFDDRKNYLAYFLLTMAILSRPECALFLASAIIRDIIIWFRQSEKRFLPWLVRGLLIFLPLLPYLAFNYSTTGLLCPKTFEAKVLGRGLFWGIANGDYKRIINSLTIGPLSYTLDINLKLFLLQPLLFLGFYAGIVKFFNAPRRLGSKGIMLASLVFLYFPIMGAISPVLMPTFQHMRMVANMIPLIILISVVGYFWQNESSSSGVIKVLRLLAIVSIILGLVMVTFASSIVRLLGPLLVQSASRLEGNGVSQIIWLVMDIGKNTLLLSFFLLAGGTLVSNFGRKWLSLKFVNTAIIICLVLFSGVFSVVRAKYYANDVKNINEVDKAAGLYLKDMMKDGQEAAVNDIGAIGYFSGVKILDLKGLVSPEITTPMIVDDSLAFEYLLYHDRVDYVAIFPNWFRYIPTRTDILKTEKCYIAHWNTILAGDSTIIYRAYWPDSIR
jgi:hypothetical protein